MPARRPLLAVTLLALLCVPAAAAPERRTAPNGLSAAGEASGFEVFVRSAVSGREVFCAAGHFARTALGSGATDRVTIVAPLGPSATRPGQRSVTFALTAPARGPVFGDPILRIRRTGGSLTVGHAQFLCNTTFPLQID
jgi:hypothetical protein